LNSHIACVENILRNLLIQYICLRKETAVQTEPRYTTLLYSVQPDYLSFRVKIHSLPKLFLRNFSDRLKLTLESCSRLLGVLENCNLFNWLRPYAATGWSFNWM